MVFLKVKMDLIGKSYDQITVGDLIGALLGAILMPYWGLLGGCWRVSWGLYMGSLPPSDQPVRAQIEPEPSHEPSGDPRKVWDGLGMVWGRSGPKLALVFFFLFLCFLCFLCSPSYSEAVYYLQLDKS